MMNVPPLKALCVGKITTEIWRNRVTLDFFVTQVRSKTGRRIYVVGNLGNKDYLDEFENIFNQIMGLLMPDKIKLRLCAAFSNLALDAYSCCEDAEHLFAKDQKQNMLILMSQLCFTPTGLVDRSKTIVRSIMPSCGNLKINYQSLERFCCLNKEKITEHVNGMYTDQYSRKILKKLLNQKVNLDSYEPNMLVDKAVNGSNLIFEYMYDKCTDVAKPRYLCRMLFLILFSGDGCDNWNKRHKLIFIYERLSEEIWQKVIILYGKNLVQFFLMTEQIDYCIHFYKQVCLYAPEYCHDILEYAFDSIYAGDEYKYSKKIFEKLDEETFFSIWLQTPAEIKNGFISDNVSKYRIYNFKNYEHISTILNDPALSEQNKNHLIDFLIINFKCYSDKTENEVLLKRLVNEFRNNSDFLDVPTLKSIFEKRFFYMHGKFQAGTTLSDKDLMELKTLVSKDEDFIENVMKNMFRCGCVLTIIQDALKFQFGDKRTELIKYVTEKFVHLKNFVAVYHTVLERMRYENRMNSFYIEETPRFKFLIDLFQDATVKRVIKKLFKETDIFKDYLGRILVPEPDRYLVVHKWSPFRHEHIPFFFTNVLTKAQIKQKMQSYLLSETCINDILNAYIMSFTIKNYDSQTVDKELLILAQRSYMLFVEYWLKSYNLRSQFINYFLNNVKEVYRKNYKPLDEEQLLPNQSREEYEKIVNAFYKLFVAEIRGLNYASANMDMSENTTAYSEINKLANLRVLPLIDS